MKKLYPITEDTPEELWHTMDDDAFVLQAPDESAFGELRITLCDSPPYDLDFYNEKEFVYWVGGNWREKFLKDFVDYIKMHLTASLNAELLIFWAGDGKQKMKRQKIHIEEKCGLVHQLERVRGEEYIRVSFV